MMMIRKITAMMVVGALSVGAFAPTALADGKKGKGNDHRRPKYEQEFKDWNSGFWANEALARMITRGVIQGNGDATIASDRPVTRLEAAIMLSRLLELEAPEIPQGEFEIKAPWGKIEIKNKRDEFEIEIKTKDGEWEFEDDDDIPAWGRAAILTGLKEGFLIFDGASLSPMKPLSRLEAAIMMVKAAGLDAEAQAKAGADLDFSDEHKIPERLRGYIALAVENGFVTGFEDGTFRPQDKLTRAQWAALLDRLDRTKGPAVSADGRQIKGVVSDVDSGSVTVITPVYPGGVTYQLDPEAVFYKSGKEISTEEIQVDDQVILNLDAEREIVLLSVANVVRQVNGQVEAFASPTSNSSGIIEVKENGSVKSYTVTSNTKVKLGSAAATFADVLQGDQVSLKLEGNRVTEIAIKVEAKTINATLDAINFGTNSTLPSLVVAGEDNVTHTYNVADHAVVKAANGSAISLDDLIVGDLLTLKVERDLITAIQVKPAQVRTLAGAVEGFVSPTQSQNGQITLAGKGTFDVTPGTQVLLGNKAANFDELLLGDQVTLTFEGLRLTKIAIKVEAVTVTGTLDSVQFGTNTTLPSLTVTGSDDESTTYDIADHATVKATNGSTISLEDLVQGDQLSLKVERNLVTAIQVANVVRTVSGTVDSFISPTQSQNGEITLAGTGSFTVTDAAQVTLANRAAAFTDVLNGDRVTLTIEGTRVTKIAIRVEAVTVIGTLQEINFGTDLVLPTLKLLSNGRLLTYSVADAATIKAANGTLISLEELEDGARLTITVERNQITAIQVR